MKAHITNIAITLLNIFLLGSGWILIGRYKIAALTQFLFLSLIAALIYSRNILYLDWFLAASIGLLFTLLLNSLYIIKINSIKNTTGSIKPKHVFITFAYILSSFIVLMILFIYKNFIFGIQIYYIPSVSMHPTLKKGDIILVDTWAFDSRNPKSGDIVIFKLVKKKGYFVKRVSKWPNSQALKKQGKWYVLGDNHKKSTDSRKFGGINKNQIKGKVTQIIATYRINKGISFTRKRVFN